MNLMGGKVIALMSFLFGIVVVLSCELNQVLEFAIGFCAGLVILSLWFSGD